MKGVSLIGIIMLFLTGSIGAQNLGVLFNKELTWNNLRERARRERKYIFIDCYATWCGPCQFMTDSIFTDVEVGKFVNANFISAQVQMDTSKNDNSFIKSWYKDANAIRNVYKIAAFPTYLFFNSDGKIVHIGVGVKDDKGFRSLAADAIDTSKQYFVLLDKFEKGCLNFELFRKLAYASKEIGDKNMALRIAGDYMHKYLDQLPDPEFCKKENFDFIGDFYNVFDSRDRIFKLYYTQAARVDSIMQQEGYAKGFIDYIISKEEIAPAIIAAKSNNISPNWNLLIKKIQKKYNKDYAQCNVLNAKIGWLKYRKDWKRYTQNLVQSIEMADISKLSPGAGNILYLNNSAWEVFQYSSNIEELKKAICWVNTAIQMDTKPSPALMDTKSNLLYKIGKKNDAIKLQQEVVYLEPNYTEFKITLEKMRHGIPTWRKINEETK